MWRSSLLLFWSLLERKTWFRSSVVLLTHCPCHEHSEDAAATQPWCAEIRGMGMRTLGWWKSCTQAPSLPLPAPSDLSLSEACLWSSALKFCPESVSCSILGHSDILSLLLLFEQIATLALFSFLQHNLKIGTNAKNETEKEVTLLSFSSSPSTILPYCFVIYEDFFILATLVCEPFQIPKGSWRVTALGGRQTGFESWFHHLLTV